MRAGLTIALMLVAAPALRAQGGDRVLRAAITLDAPVSAVWRAWTTEAGVRSFFAPDCRIEPRVDGAYEIFFDPAAPAGRRGADGMRILVFEPERRLAFTWNAPESLGAVRDQRTLVTLEFTAIGAAQSRLRFSHAGWGDGPEWDAAFTYFEKAWGGFVLPSLIRRFQRGPIDWQRPPDLLPITGMRRALTEAR